ncbi:hypothetical protein N474_00275 [Pseudoalteromonas luteoviolacea CPMOR-2]|uniref:Uncharacterized protein n=1 Tax=Pseudoalteromonas luteoviolacea DSM 6061 TaxID=1365250 RepID=A0A161ZXS3_9GAMM|nr:hypothetical protein [Pseudoalteromonas luteoviolacea]KZN37760.1 hypothetical protein N475_02790 [Pseudoalteromonas luteoviolacea DSM 6061]KZN60649.1 hypothetical protein N474_00275 [Pseudoalteromonas luteoviolacea CPMOR-2]MBE0386814.1 hypothetical protein [Pseudoalteromonas luteoviolacea DSM 6061]
MYQKTQLAWAIWGILAWLSTFVVMGLVLLGNNIGVLAFGIILLLVAFVFYGLTIKVDNADKQISWWFGPGVAKKTLNFDDIDEVKAVTNSFSHGIGMRISHDGWVYSVSGFKAIEVSMSDGTKYRLGTSDQHGLLEALKSKVKEQTTEKDSSEDEKSAL